MANKNQGSNRLCKNLGDVGLRYLAMKQVRSICVAGKHRISSRLETMLEEGLVLENEFPR